MARIELEGVITCIHHSTLRRRWLLGSTHAYYVNVPFSSCPGYLEKRHLKKQWLTPWVKGLIGADKEILESVQSGFFMITGVKRDEWFR